MKKIIGTAVLAVLAAGAVFAAEPKIGMKYRTQANLYSKVDNDTTTTTTWLDQDAVGAAKDEFKFTATTDYAGVVIDTNVNDSSAVKVDQYYGWMNFGALKLTGGLFDSRFTNRADDGIGEISLTDGFKLGVLNGKIGADADNMGAVLGKKVLTFTADYTIKDLPGDLLIKAALNTKEYAKDTDAKDPSSVESGFGIEAAYTAEAFSADVVFKKPYEDQMVIGVFVKPLSIEKLNAVIGFTYAADTDDYDSTDTKSLNNMNKYSEFGVDARASYQVSDAIAAILHMNYSSYDYDADDTASAYDHTALYVAGELSYVINDTFTAGIDVAYNNEDFGDDNKTDDGTETLSVKPMLVITAGKGAAISTGLNYTTALNSDDGTFQNSIKIPFIFRVAL